MNKAGDENRSVRFTKTRIKNAFFDLLREKDLHHITVADVVRTADISRATFYLHYADIYDFLNQTEDDIIRQVLDEIEKFDEDAYVVGEFPIAVKTFSVLYAHADELQLLTGKNGDVNFLPKMQNVLHEYFTALLSLVSKDTQNIAPVLSFLIGGVLTMFFDNLCTEEPKDIQTLAFIANRYLRATNKLIGLPLLEDD